MKNRELITTLCAAFGPTLIVIGLSKITGTSADMIIAGAGAVSTSHALLTSLIHRKHMTFSKGERYV